MALRNIISHKVSAQKRKIDFWLTLNPFLFLRNLSIVENGYIKDFSAYKKQVQPATIVVENDALIMPANDNDIIAALTAADLYDVFYTDNDTPKQVLIADIVSNYNLFKDGNKLILFDPNSDFLQALTDESIYVKNL